MTVLGISVGTSRTAVCVLQDGKLLDRHIHNYPTTWSDTKLRIILNRYRQYLKQYSVSAIMVKIPPKSRRSNALLRLIRRIDALAKEYHCDFDLVTKDELKQAYTLSSTEALITFTKLLYPAELSALYEKGNHEYNKKLYEAVLSAHTYQEWQRKHRERAEQ